MNHTKCVEVKHFCCAVKYTKKGTVTAEEVHQRSLCNLEDNEGTQKEVVNHAVCDGTEDERCNIIISSKRAEWTLENKQGQLPTF